MNVNGIANGSAIKIHAKVNGHNLVIMTEAIFGVSAGLLIKPIEYFGRYMQFLEPSEVEIRNKRDGRVYKFYSTTISPVKTRYGNYHLIRTEAELEPENSRKSERFFIEKLGLFSINGNDSTLKNCIIHDISMRGISIIVDNESAIKPGDKININFRYGPSLHNYEVKTVVVRNFTVHNKPAAGCSIENMNVDLVSLINDKRKEKYPELDKIPATNLNPEISEKEQIREVEEDIAKQLIPEKTKAEEKTITNESPFAPENLEHISSNDKTLRQKKKDQKNSMQARAIENLLNLKDL